MSKQEILFPVNDLTQQEVRALTWKEPYASLMLHGKIETRTWPTKYRGLVLICAALRPYDFDSVRNIAGDAQMDRAFVQLGHIDPFPTLTLGKAIAVGRLVDCRPMTKADEDAAFVQYREPWINEKGKQKQLWCHIYEDVRPIKPLPWKGKQGWSTLTQEQKALIEYQPNEREGGE